MLPATPQTGGNDQGIDRFGNWLYVNVMAISSCMRKCSSANNVYVMKIIILILLVFPAELSTAVRIIYVAFVLAGMKMNYRYIMIFMYNRYLGER